MKIVQVAPLEEPVPPKTYGGTELVVYNVIEEMVKLGHEVHLLGTGDSHTSAHLVPIVEESIRNAKTPHNTEQWRNFMKIFHIPTILKVIKELKPDIVHNHCSWRILQFADFIECPMFTTVHGSIASPHERYTFEKYKTQNFVSISDNQRLAMPEINWLGTVYNGIDVDAFTLNKKDDRAYFAFLGRTSPEKGLKEICLMIKKTNHVLKIAAKIDAVDREYFEKEIQPLIDGKQIQFIGEVNHTQKVEFLKNAKALLLWLNWEEPFGLVVVEAMACGTPVIVNKRGSMPEIVVDTKTGFLINTIDDMLAAIEKIQTIKPQACYDHVAKHFSAKKMAQSYVDLARTLVR